MGAEVPPRGGSRASTAPGASGGRPRVGIRVRTTLAAVAVVALVLLLGSVALVLAVRAAMSSSLTSTAETRAEQVAGSLQSDPATFADFAPVPSHIGEGGDREGEDPAEEIVWILDRDSGQVVSSDPGTALPVGELDDDELLELPDADSRYQTANEEVAAASRRFLVVAAVSREDLDDTTAALVPALVVAVPLLVLLVGATVWVVIGRALRPVEAIRSRVAAITDERLDERVPEPGTRDQIGTLAVTMNQMLERLQTSREQQQSFVSDASHELRSPIATLRQCAEVAVAHPDAFEPGELVEIVGSESLRMQRLVEQLLTLTRAEEHGPGASSDIDLDDLVLAEAARVRHQGLQVDTSGVRPVRLRGSATAWAQVVRNLVDNAARHAASTIRLEVEVQGATARLVVCDDGSGVPTADRDRIFDRFVRLDAARSRDAGGSGLGLAIVRDLVRSQGGRVRVGDSDLGGAAFTVEVPRTT